MLFLESLALGLIKWLLEKGLLEVEHLWVQWMYTRNEEKALADNQKKLQEAIKNGNKEAIDKAGENSLNNVSQP